jgi:hypothetical protein
LDGKLIPIDYMIRTQSQLFNFALPIHSILEIKGKITNQAISDVTGIFLQPLSVGTHSVTFRGDYDLNLNFKSNDDTYYAIPEG